MQLSRFNRILLQTLFLPVIALLCVSGVLVWQILRAERTVDHIEVADQNIATANAITALIVDEETGVRGFQNTSEEIFLQPYAAAAAPLRQSLQDLRGGIASQHADLSSIDALEQAHQRWVDNIALPIIDAVRSGRDTRDTATNLRGMAYMDNIRAINSSIIEAQKRERNLLVQHWKHEVDHTLEATVGLAIVIGLLIGAFARNRLHLVSDAFQTTFEEQRRTQAALLASEKLAVAGRLAASIAHEIHNPLDAVVNLLYLMKQGATAEELREFVDIAQAELARVTQISRAMLGMYRESPTPLALNISEIVQSVLILLDRQLIQAGVSVDLQSAPDPIATGFPAELRQVFTNLLTNAAHASKSGDTIEIRIRPHPSPSGSSQSSGELHAAGSGVIVTITDHGPGITTHDKERLFQPFFTTKGEQGTGLGLWISQGIVHKHGGTITIDTSTAPSFHGTTITVFLPHGEAA